MGTSEAGRTGRLGPARRYARHKFISFSETLGFSTPKAFAGEILILLALCAAAGTWAVFLFSQFEFTRLCSAFDFWFDSDPARTISNITTRWGQFHERSTLHPLYSLFIAAPFGVVGELLQLRTSTVTALYVGMQSAFYAAAAYIAMRAFGLVRLDALLGVLLIYSTAASIYWIGFPEWLAFGVVSMLVSLIWVNGPSALRNSVTGVAQNLLSGSIVVTSWVIGMAASLISDWPKLRWHQAYTHTRDALAIMAALTVVQYLLFPHAGGFINIWPEVRLALAGSDSAGPSLLGLSVELFGHTLLAPQAAILDGPRTVPGWGILIMTSQGQGVSVTPHSILILGLWAALLALGVLAAIRGNVRPKVVVSVGGALAFFYALHILFGGEVFLFSLHFAPFLAFIALWGALSQHKTLVRALCAALIVASFTFNYPAFTSAVASHNAIDSSWIDRVSTASDEAKTLDCR